MKLSITAILSEKVRFFTPSCIVFICLYKLKIILIRYIIYSRVILLTAVHTLLFFSRLVADGGPQVDGVTVG